MTLRPRPFWRGGRLPGKCAGGAAILVVSLAWAADESQLALALRAQADFDRVGAAAALELAAASRCLQSQAAALSVAPPTELALLHFHKGYCALALGVITRAAPDFQQAAQEFDKSIETWPQRALNPKTGQTEPLPPALRILAQVARLEAGGTSAASNPLRQQLSLALLASTGCQSSLMSPKICQDASQLGWEWLGWLALRSGDLFDASSYLSRVPASPWYHWARGREAFRDRNYQTAAAEYQTAVRDWQEAQAGPPSPWSAGLSPLPAMPEALADLGGAQLLNRDFPAALASLNAAVRADPMQASAIYLRARAREQAGQADLALADYNLASRTALATASDVTSGEAHFYRGILLYRRKQLSEAEDEFSTALNLDLPARWRADVPAWRQMAAVAQGACGASRTYLEESLARVSPYFPKDEAYQLAASCSR
jgi:tetratricopeptide (TPR) repeat protein